MMTTTILGTRDAYTLESNIYATDIYKGVKVHFLVGLSDLPGVAYL